MLDLRRDLLLHGQERVLGRRGLAMLTHDLRQVLHPRHPWISIGAQRVLQAIGMQVAQRLGDWLGHPGSDPRAHERAVPALGDLRDARHRRERPLVLARVLQHPDVIQRAPLEADQVAPGHELGVGCPRLLVLDHHLPEAGRQRLDDVERLHDLGVLTLGDPARHEDAEVPDVVVQDVDDRLLAGQELPVARVAVEDPVERLLGRSDAVTPGGEDDDGRADVAEVDPPAGGGHDLAGREAVTHEEVVHDEPHLLLVQQEEAAPPALEVEVARLLGIDLRVEVVRLLPQRVGRVQALEVGHQVHAVEATVAEIAGQRGQPRAAQHAARIPHRVLSPGSGPVGQRRAGQQDRPHQVGGDRAQHHHGPAGLAVADDARPAVGFGMELGDLLQEEALGPADILEGLSGHGLRPEADEVARVAGTQGHADLAVHLGAADPGTVAGARIEDDERALARIRPRAGRRDDSYQEVVDGPPERPTVEHHLLLEGEDRRLALRPRW